MTWQFGFQPHYLPLTSIRPQLASLWSDNGSMDLVMWLLPNGHEKILVNFTRFLFVMQILNILSVCYQCVVNLLSLYRQLIVSLLPVHDKLYLALCKNGMVKWRKEKTNQRSMVSSWMGDPKWARVSKYFCFGVPISWQYNGITLALLWKKTIPACCQYVARLLSDVQSVVSVLPDILDIAIVLQV